MGKIWGKDKREVKMNEKTGEKYDLTVVMA